MDELQDNIRELITDNTEAVIDTLLEDGLVKDIPVLGDIVKIIKIQSSISDRILMKKLRLFLNEFDKQSDNRKTELLRKLGDKEEKKHIGEMLILLIDKFDDFEKPTLLAKLFHCYLSGQITNDEFFRMGRTINIGFKNDLKTFLETSTIDRVEQDILNNLMSTGLSQIKKTSVATMDVALIRVEVSEIGKKFHKIMHK